MNRYCVLSGILIAIHLLSSCAEEKEHLPVDIQVNFIPSISYSGSGTRAFDGSWENDDRVGIYMVPHVADPSDPADFSVYTSDANVQYHTSTGGASAPLVAVNDGIGYPTSNTEVNFIGYYPYQSTLHSAENDIYNINVATQSPAKNIDLLYHKGTGTPYRGATAGSVGLEFQHQLSKLIISVEPASEGVAVDLSTATASLTGFPTTASFDLSTGTLGNRSGADVAFTPVKDVAGSSAGKAVFTALLVPHADGASYATRNIRVTVEGKHYNYPLPTTHPFEPGLAYNYKFKLNKGAELILSQNTIVDWEDHTVIANVIAVDRYNIELPGDINKGTIYVIGNTIAISTTSTDPLESHLSDEESTITVSKPDWITTILSPGSAGTDGWTNYELSFEVESNPNNFYRTGYIHFVVNGLTTVVRVNQGIAKADIANSYMVTPGGSVAIPIERAMTICGMGPDEPFTIENLWDDNNVYAGYTVSGTGRDREIIVTTNNASGNALIALMHDGLVYWSWHLWVSDYDCSTTWTNNGFEAMDRNLGAIAADNSVDARGLFYQWGRKDPCPGSGTAGNGVTVENKFKSPKTSTVDLEVFRNDMLYAIQNPNIYIEAYSSSVAGGTGWYWILTKTSSYEKHLWYTTDSKKTIYDPCPPGWKTPASATDFWKNVTTPSFTGNSPQAGADFGTNALYPAAGMRGLVSGKVKVEDAGYVGHYWSGYGGNQRCLMFSTSGYTSISSEKYDSALSVRCTKE